MTKITKMETARQILDIHQAAYIGDIDSLRSLLRNGGNVDTPNEVGNTPLVSAFIGKGKQKVKEKMVDLLLDFGANVNAVNDQGDSVLHVLVQATFHTVIPEKMIEKLMMHGADLSLVDSNNLNPIQFSYERNNHKLGSFLLFYENPALRKK